MNDQAHRRSKFLDGIEYRFSSDWIHRLETEEHWRSYWHQLGLILPNVDKEDSILEIGPGSGFLTNYLRSKGFKVTTLDIDDEKSPDIIANIVDYSFPDVYDHILAFEVFEHIPYDKFEGILLHLQKSARKNLFLSVPQNYRIWFHAELIVPYFKEVSFSIKTKRRRIITNNHFWELAYKKFTAKRLIQSLEKAGLQKVVEKTVKTMVFYQFRTQAGMPDSKL